ncbi:MAG: RHS repeat protein [Nitrospiraceae bacterium]|nr:RHS repeat protein [Nitrospiraceae bacterium]
MTTTNLKLGGLTLILLAIGTYLILLLVDSQYGGSYFFLFMAIAIIGVGLSLFLRNGEVVLLVLGLIFWAQGLSVLISYWSQGADALDFLVGLSVLGIPFGTLCISIFLLWRYRSERSRGLEVTQYVTCVLIHIVNFSVAMLPLWSQLTRFAGALLGIVFSLVNFARLGRAWDHGVSIRCGYILVSAVLLLPLAHISADTGKYLYDEVGRLIGVADSAGVTAVYNYDTVGNLTSIDRFTPPGSGIGIYLAAPGSGPATTQVTIQGYGFVRPQQTTRSSLMGPLPR